MDIQIRSAEKGDLDQIALVHMAAFKGFFLTKLGAPFLIRYYELILNYAGGIINVAVSNGQVIGFVAGFSEPSDFYALMSRCKLRFGVAIIEGVLRNPLILADVVRNIISVQQGEKVLWNGKERAIELASIAVLNSFTGSGVGSELMASFLREVKIKGVNYVYLTTDAKGNMQVNRWYQKHGFLLSQVIKQSNGREMNQYIQRLDTDSDD